MPRYELYRVVTGNDPDAREYYEQVACNGRVMWPREIVERLNTLDAVCDKAAKEIQEQQEEIERLERALAEQPKMIYESMANGAVNCGPSYGCSMARRLLEQMTSRPSGEEE